jgi:hypothetical protein
VAIWSNIVSAIILFVVVYIESVDIFFHFPKFFAIAVVFPLVLSIIEVTADDVLTPTDDHQVSCGFSGSPLSLVLGGIYYWGRMFSIIFNFVVFFFITLKLKRMAITGEPVGVTGPTSSPFFGAATHSRATTAPSGSDAVMSPTSASHIESVSNSQSLAIYTLVERMKYYPFVQALCRSGAAWNEFDNYRYSTYPSALLANICSPSTGACYFVVFLVRMCVFSASCGHVIGNVVPS